MDRVYQQKQKLHGTSTTSRRQRIYNPFILIRPFFAFLKTRRRWKNDTCSSMAEDDLDDTNARRVSIDHTSPLQDSSRSLTGACSPNSNSSVPSNYGYAVANDEVDNAYIVPTIPYPLSKPKTLYQQPGASTSCPCLECSPSHSSTMLRQSNSDSALQARIDAIRIQQKYVGENHPDVIFALSSLAKVQEKHGNHVEAAAIRRESQMRMTLAKYESVHPMIHDTSVGGTSRLPHENFHSGMIPTEISYCHRT